MAEITIATVIVEGLHNQFDVEIHLKPGLNVIYGKNGRGKTTLLHLLANLLELDFQRFNHLQFQKIQVKTSKSDMVEIRRDDANNSPRVYLNGSKTSYAGQNSSLSEVEMSSLREALGARPTYLPAFRSILERTRADSASNFRQSERRDSDFEEILLREMFALHELDKTSLSPRATRDEAGSTAEKTALCRQWFGKFVPVVRYPSVADVEDALTEEWRKAQIDITDREQRMFMETFVKVFRAISATDATAVAPNSEDLLPSILALLNDQASQQENTAFRPIYNNLLGAAKSLNGNDASLRSIDKSLLEIYRQALETRSEERHIAFARSREFESSINRFLDGKTLSIGQVVSQPRSRSVVSVTTNDEHSYGLSALSSGERQILTMLYSASRTRYLSGIFLIDEPELSLHIDWQRIILRELQKQSPERQIIACTHSPEVGAEHLLETQDFEPKISAKKQADFFSVEDI